MNHRLLATFFVWCVAFLSRGGLLAWDAPLNSTAPVAISNVSVGFDGKYKVGHWTPVWIELAAQVPCTCRVEVVVSDPDGAEVSFDVGESPVCTLDADGPQRVLRYVRFGRARSGIGVQVRTNEQVVARRDFPRSAIPTGLPSTNSLIVSLGTDVGWDEAIRRISGGELERAALAPLSSIADLPHSWFGYEGVSIVAIVAGDGDLVQQMTDAQRAALAEWIRMGGKLVVSCGQAAERLFGEGGPLTAMVPARFVRSQPLPSTNNIERYTEATQRIARGTRLTVAYFSDLPVNAELEETLGVGETAPLLARLPLGFGTVILATFDLDAEPLQNWPGRSSLAMQILAGQVSTRQSQDRPETTESGQLGYRDMTGQLRATLDQFGGVTLIQFPWIVAIVSLYLLLIGPADYFLFRKLGLAPHWTWVTFPLIALGFVGLAIGLQQAKGNRTQANVVTVTDFDQATRQLRGTGWLHVYSPKEQRMDLAFLPEGGRGSGSSGSGDPLGALSVWQGLAGDGFGGIDSDSEARPFPGTYSIEANQYEPLQVSLKNVPLQVGTTRSVTGRWWGTMEPAGESSLSVDPDGLLVGEIANPFPMPLDESYVYYENWAYRVPRSLKPGDRFSFERQRPLNLHWRLTHRRVEKSSELTTPWDPASRDLSRVMELLLFYRAAGGDSYTRLSHRYQPFLDCSDLLRSGRAVLVGRTHNAPSGLLLSGEPADPEGTQTWTIRRAVFPVARTAR